MAKAKAIVKRRKTVHNTRKITRTMELVSTAKFKQSHDRIHNAMPYRNTLQEMMADLARVTANVEHPLLRRREQAKHVTLLVLTSNRGLCGGFNSNLCKRGLSFMQEPDLSQAEFDVHVSGKKGISYYRFIRRTLAQQYTHFGDKPSYADVERLADDLIAAYENERTDRVAIVYQRFMSAGLQRPHVQVLLPITQAAPEPSTRRAAAQGPHVPDYIFSPNAQELLQELLPAYFKTTLYHVFLETVVGEHRARMVAMKNATDAAEEMAKILTRRYNRARQTQITNEISEIMGGVEALK